MQHMCRTDRSNKLLAFKGNIYRFSTIIVYFILTHTLNNNFSNHLLSVTSLVKTLLQNTSTFPTQRTEQKQHYLRNPQIFSFLNDTLVKCETSTGPASSRLGVELIPIDR